jgi:hypothetical protein
MSLPGRLSEGLGQNWAREARDRREHCVHFGRARRFETAACGVLLQRP